MKIVLRCFVALLVILFCAVANANAEEVDQETGLVMDDNFPIVKKNCTICHSAKLILQNRADREGWSETIRWMQAEQGLRQFEPETEKRILDYLAEHYAPARALRRPPLQVDLE